MHPRNQYRTRLDFCALAESYPPLKPFLLKHTSSSDNNHVIDFRNAVAQREDTTLTQALLRRDFALSLCLPDDRLCPPVPNRLNYVLWIQDIISPTAKEIRGLDIGTGASVIYPLLACSLSGNSNWSFVATEIDLQSMRYAAMNIENNNLASRITLHPVSADSEFILAPLFTNPNLYFDFTMCNPPFYGSTEEIEFSAENKESPPNAVCTGAENEMITPGGETAFVLKILKESCHQNIKYRCRWFTSMLGKLSSIEIVVSELRSLKIDNYALAQFVQGTTRRWCVAWSFGDERLPDKYSRPTVPSLLPFIPLPTTLQQRLTTTSSRTRTLLTQILSSIEKLSFTFMEGKLGTNTETGLYPDDKTLGGGAEWSCTISAFENTWSRAARRSRKRAQHEENHTSILSNHSESFQFKNDSPGSMTTSEQVESKIISNQREVEWQNGALRDFGIITKAKSDTFPSDVSESTSLNPLIVPTISPDQELPRPILVCRISAGHCHDGDNPESNHCRNNGDKIEGLSSSAFGFTVLTAQWLRGVDRFVFEGFWSHVSRKLKGS